MLIELSIMTFYTRETRQNILGRADNGGGELVIERIHHKPETRANFNDPFSEAVRNNLKLPVKIISSLVGELARWKRADL